MREAYERGVLLCGIGAGANCWAEGSHTDSFGPLTYLPDGRVDEAVAGTEGARVYRVEADGRGGVREQALACRLLGASA